MNYEVYRNTTLGCTLQEVLDDLLQSNQITERLANRILKEFDKSINNALATRVKTRYNFKGTLNTYRFCDNVWTLLFKQIEFRETQQEKITAYNVKFVACDGKRITEELDENMLANKLNNLVKCSRSRANNLSIAKCLSSFVNNVNSPKSSLSESSAILKESISTIKSEKSSTNESSTEKKSYKIRLFASLCIERMPVITCDMNELEQRYSNLINEINIKKSYYSNHELRHLNELKAQEKKKKLAEKGVTDEITEIVVETAVDFEEKCLRELKAINLAKRNLSTDKENQISENEYASSQTISYLKNADHILDKKLILLVYDKETSCWQLPYLDWNENDGSLRMTVERLLKHKLDENLKVEILGNAPVGIFKSRSNDEIYLNKYYFFKAQYKSGADELATKTNLDFVWIRKDELKYFIKNKNYLECLNNFTLDF